MSAGDFQSTGQTVAIWNCATCGGAIYSRISHVCLVAAQPNAFVFTTPEQKIVELYRQIKDCQRCNNDLLEEKRELARENHRLRELLIQERKQAHNSISALFAAMDREFLRSLEHEVKGPCDRCRKEFDGYYGVTFTAGYYDVRGGYWAKYANEGETMLCDPCMHTDSRYIADYGDMASKAVLIEGAD